MKFIGKKIICVTMAFAMLVAICGCKSKDTDEEGSDYDVEYVYEYVSGDNSSSSSNESTDSTEKTGNSSKKNSTTTSGSSTNSKTKSWEEIKASIPSKLKGTTITFYNWNPSNSFTGSSKAIAAFTKETGIKVNWVTGTYDDYITKITAMVASGDSPDIIRMRDTNVNILQSLQPISNLGYDFTDGAWNQELMNLYKVNGKTYGMILKDTPYFFPAVMYYNRSLISRYNLEDPYNLWKQGKWTWKKMASMCSEFVSAAGTEYEGYTMPDGGEYMRCMGVTYITYDASKSKYVSHMDDTRIVKAWQFVSKNVKEGNFSNTVYNLDGFDNGTILFHANSAISSIRAHFHVKKLISNGDLGTVPMPTVDGQKTYYQELGENIAFGVPKGAKNKEAVPYFLRYYLDCANYDMNDFYCDSQAKEVVDWCRNQTFFTNMDVLLDKSRYGDSVHDMSYLLRQTESAQIKSNLDKYTAMVAKCVNDSNKSLESLK